MTLAVLHVHAGHAWGGVETALAALVRADAGLTHAFAVGWPTPVAERLRPLGPLALLGRARLSRIWTVRRSRRALAAVLAEQRPDVCMMHSTWALAVWGPAVVAAGVPLVVWHHGRPVTGMIGALASRVAVTRHLANSAWTAAAVPGATLLHPPIAFPRARAEPHDVRARIGTPDDRLVLLSAARWEPGKGQDVLVEALAGLDDLPWELWLAGGTSAPREQRYARRVRARAQELGMGGRIRWLDHRDDVADLMGAADVYVQPNTAPEAFGLSLVEALDARLPVVTSRLGGAPEVVADDCGILLPPGDSAALASALRALAADPARRARLGAAGPARAAALSAPAAAAGRLAALLQATVAATFPAP